MAYCRAINWLNTEEGEDEFDDGFVDFDMISMTDSYVYNPNHGPSVYYRDHRDRRIRSDQMADVMTSYLPRRHGNSFCQLSSAQSFKECSLDTMGIDSDNNWQRLHPSKWTKGDVMDLIYFVAQASNIIDATHLRGEKFQDIDGRRLPSMTKKDFIERDPTYGELLYDTVIDLLDKCQFLPPDEYVHIDRVESPPSPEPEVLSVKRPVFHCYNDERRPPLPKPVEDLLMDPDISDGPSGTQACNDDDMQPLSLVLRHVNRDVMRPPSQPAAVVRIHGHAYDFDSEADFRSVVQPNVDPAAWDLCQDRSNDSCPKYADISMVRSHYNNHLPIDLRVTRPPKEVSSSWHRADDWPEQTAVSSREFPINIPTTVSMSKRKSQNNETGSAVKKSRSISNDGTSLPAEDLSDIGGLTNGGRHLWEFIRDLLKAGDRYNGGSGTVLVPGNGSEAAKNVSIDSIIRWENREDGVFRIIDSKIVAQLWGCRKHNSTMTYEKLSRALRWCRKNQFFAALPKNEGYPKKLCFKFGPLANNWRDS